MYKVRRVKIVVELAVGNAIVAREYELDPTRFELISAADVLPAHAEDLDTLARAAQEETAEPRGFFGRCACTIRRFFGAPRSCL